VNAVFKDTQTLVTQTSSSIFFLSYKLFLGKQPVVGTQPFIGTQPVVGTQPRVRGSNIYMLCRATTTTGESTFFDSGGGIQRVDVPLLKLNSNFSFAGGRIPESSWIGMAEDILLQGTSGYDSLKDEDWDVS